VIRLSTDDIVVTSSVLGALEYDGALDEVQLAETLELFQEATAGTSIPIEVVLPVDVPTLVAEGHDLAAATGELSQWIEGTTYEERRIRVIGRIADPEYGAKEEAVRFSLESQVWRDSSLIPELDAEVNAQTWGSMLVQGFLGDADLGLHYPVIFGTPGKLSDGSFITGSFAPWIQKDAIGVDHHRLVLAGHRVFGTRIQLNNDGNVTGFRLTIEHITDDFGRTIAIVSDGRGGTTGSGTGGVSATTDSDGEVAHFGLQHATIDSTFHPLESETAPIYASWYAGSSTEKVGGLVGGDGKLVRSAGDVLEYLLGRTSFSVDQGALAAAKPLLTQFRIDAAIDDRVKIWDWVRGNLLPILPVSIVSGPSGLEIIVWRYDATVHDAVAHFNLDDDPTIERVGRVRYDSSKIINDFSLKYALSVRTGNYHLTTRLGAGPYSTSDRDTKVSYHCALSQSRLATDLDDGIRQEEMETLCVYEDATANAVVAWRALAFALPHRNLDLLASEQEWGWLKRGNVVLITSKEIQLLSQVALVEETQSDGSDMLGIRFRLIEDPARESRKLA
jgi:hypothetical protein